MKNGLTKLPYLVGTGQLWRMLAEERKGDAGLKLNSTGFGGFPPSDGGNGQTIIYLDKISA